MLIYIYMLNINWRVRPRTPLISGPSYATGDTFRLHEEWRAPLRPIVSISGTVTHDVAQYLNDLIRPFLNSKNLVKSSDEFLQPIKNLD